MKIQRSIFECDDYRKYLHSTFLILKEKNSKVSLESISRKIGISKSYVRYIFEGKRHVTLDLIPKIVKALHLERREQQVLTYMVCRDTCQDQEAKSFFQSVIAGLSDPGVEGALTEVLSEEKSTGLFNNSLAMILHSLSKQEGFTPKAEWVRERLCNDEVGVEVIQTTLDFLVKSKSVIQDEKGKWKPAAFIFNSPGNDVLNGYQIYKVGLKAVDSVVDTPEKYKPLNFNMLSLSFDEKNVGEVTTLLRECRDALIRVSQTTTQPTHVVFINLNSATMAKTPGEAEMTPFQRT